MAPLPCCFTHTQIGNYVAITRFVMATVLDQVTACSAVATCINNTGPGFGDVGTDWVEINDPARWALGFAMLRVS